MQTYNILFLSLVLVTQLSAGLVDDYKIDVRMDTFLGNNTRTYYGQGPVPDKLDIIWQTKLGVGTQYAGGKSKKAAGVGWPGQATLVQENGRLYVLTSSYDYNLYKLDAETGAPAWKHKFNYISKCCCNIIANDKSATTKEKGIILAGSRYNRRAPDETGNLRAVSLETGESLWGFLIPETSSYSRDVDSTGLVYEDRLYLGAENGMFYVFDLFDKEHKFDPKLVKEFAIHTSQDIINHGRNCVTESFPSVLEDRIYVSAGSGHIYGIDMKSLQITWDFVTGSDMDSSVVVTNDGYLLCGIEKQYIKGKGGLIKLDPRKPEQDAVVWYFPVGNTTFGGWLGGIIGSPVIINDKYAACLALDGFLYIVSLNDTVPDKTVPGFNPKYSYPTPMLIRKIQVGPSISTPIFVDGHLVVCGYSGFVRVFKVEPDQPDGLQVTETAAINFGASIESTPVVWDGKVYIGCRNGYFYCLGQKK
jgi:outer membrane protein assembly factor BamB